MFVISCLIFILLGFRYALPRTRIRCVSVTSWQYRTMEPEWISSLTPGVTVIGSQISFLVDITGMVLPEETRF